MQRFGCLLAVLLLCQPAIAQQLTPRPTPVLRDDAERSDPRLKEQNSFRLPVVQFEGVRLEARSSTRLVFSDVSSLAENKRLFLWESGQEDLVDTELIGLPGSVIMPEDGRYMLFLYDELAARTDINGDGESSQTLLRFYHFASARSLTLGIPARSGEEVITDVVSGVVRTQRQFEFDLLEDQLLFSVSPQLNNKSSNAQQRQANWQMVDMNQVIYQIIGTPTPMATYTPTPTPTEAATPTPSPTVDPQATPTPRPTIPLELRQNADINGDGIINPLDLLLFQKFWFLPANPSPTPTIAF